MAKNEKPKPIPLGHYLTVCRYTLASVSLSGRWFLAACGSSERYRDLPCAGIELQSFLTSLGRAHRLLGKKLVPAAASADLKVKATAFVKRLPDATVLRNMVEHPETLAHAEMWTTTVPVQQTIDLGGTTVKLEGVARTEGAAGHMVALGPQGVKVAFIAGRLDAIDAINAADEVLGVIERDVKDIFEAQRAKRASERGKA